MKDIDTFKPLSNSPPPVKVNWLPIENDLPALAAPPFVCDTFIEAPPATDTSPAYADCATMKLLKQLSLLFKSVHINYSFYLSCFYY